MTIKLASAVSGGSFINENGIEVLKIDAQGFIVPGKASAFSAHNNGVAQSIPGQQLIPLSFSTERYDLNGDFAASAWTPPAGRPVVITGACAMTISGTAMFVALYKNNAPFAYGTRTDNVAGSPSSIVCAQDIPNGTDVYTLRIYQGTGGALNTIGIAELTYFQGTRL